MAILLIQLVDTVLSLYSLAIVARSFLSLAGMDTYNPVARFLYDITEPVLAPLRRYTIAGVWDLSPMAALVLLMVVRQVLVATLSALR